MSRIRTRPTREQTIGQLFAAAARVFAEHGIGAASIETIAAAAGLTRGAFYFNFSDKDELIIAMLEDHAQRSLEYYRALLARHPQPTAFVEALRLAGQERGDDPIGSAPVLHIELILYVAREQKRRPQLAKRLRARRALMAEMVEGVNRAAKVEDVAAAWAAGMLVALEDGYRLHRLIDPKSTAADSFERTVAELQRLIYERRRS
jgi:AcrR family transcriptional regulator